MVLSNGLCGCVQINYVGVENCSVVAQTNRVVAPCFHQKGPASCVVQKGLGMMTGLALWWVGGPRVYASVELSSLYPPYCSEKRPMKLVFSRQPVVFKLLWFAQWVNSSVRQCGRAKHVFCWFRLLGVIGLSNDLCGVVCLD